MNQRVFVAVGYTLSSNGLIVGDDGVIIVDPGHAIPASRTVREAFAAGTNKPVKAIIYTYGHPDHMGGAGAFNTSAADIQVSARGNFVGGPAALLDRARQAMARGGLSGGGPAGSTLVSTGAGRGCAEASVSRRARAPG